MMAAFPGGGAVFCGPKGGLHIQDNVDKGAPVIATWAKWSGQLTSGASGMSQRGIPLQVFEPYDSQVG